MLLSPELVDRIFLYLPLLEIARLAPAIPQITPHLFQNVVIDSCSLSDPPHELMVAPDVKFVFHVDYEDLVLDLCHEDFLFDAVSRFASHIRALWLFCADQSTARVRSAQAFVRSLLSLVSLATDIDVSHCGSLVVYALLNSPLALQRIDCSRLRSLDLHLPAAPRLLRIVFSRQQFPVLEEVRSSNVIILFQTGMDSLSFVECELAFVCHSSGDQPKPQFPALEEIFFKGSTVPSMMGLGAYALKDICFTNCAIRRFDGAQLERCSQIRNLTITNSQLETVLNLRRLPLENVDFSGNFLVLLSGVLDLTSVKRMDFSRNFISSFHADFKNFPALEELDLAGNCFVSLDIPDFLVGCEVRTDNNLVHGSPRADVVFGPGLGFQRSLQFDTVITFICDNLTALSAIDPLILHFARCKTMWQTLDNKYCQYSALVSMYRYMGREPCYVLNAQEFETTMLAMMLGAGSLYLAFSKDMASCN